MWKLRATKYGSSHNKNLLPVISVHYFDGCMLGTFAQKVKLSNTIM